MQSRVRRQDLKHVTQPESIEVGFPLGNVKDLVAAGAMVKFGHQGESLSRRHGKREFNGEEIREVTILLTDVACSKRGAVTEGDCRSQVPVPGKVVIPQIECNNEFFVTAETPEMLSKDPFSLQGNVFIF